MHRKQIFSYETGKRNPTDLDLLDERSEDEIQSLTLEERTNPFVDAGVGMSMWRPRLEKQDHIVKYAIPWIEYG